MNEPMPTKPSSLDLANAIAGAIDAYVARLPETTYADLYDALEMVWEAVIDKAAEVRAVAEEEAARGDVGPEPAEMVAASDSSGEQVEGPGGEAAESDVPG